MANWVLSAQAQQDLRGIKQYTERTWGVTQALKYRAQLRECIARLSAKPNVGKNLTELKQGLRALRCQHHYVFCLFTVDMPPLIVGILHENMDLMARLAERLK
jgi:toxin ParE1/3/4